MKKISLLVLVCIVLSLVLTSCSALVNHEHTFGQDWAADKNGHYHVCDLCNTKDAEAAHVDADGNNACDVCGYTIANLYVPHEHSFSKEWSSDETNHFHACECGEKQDSAAHTADKLGVCTVCGTVVSAPNVTSIANALEVAALTQVKVTNGNLDTISYGTAYPTWYEYAENYFHAYDEINSTHTYATLDEDGSVFHLTVRVDDYLSPYYVNPDADETYMAGPVISLENAGISMEEYGILNAIAELYDFVTDETTENVTNLVETVENGTYSFSYTVTATTWWSQTITTNVEVSFTLNSESYILESASITTVDVDDANALENGYSAIQSTGVIQSHKPADLYPVSYKINKDGVDISTFTTAVEVNVGTFYLEVTDVAPLTALLEIAGVSVEVVDDAGIWCGTGSYSNGMIEVDIRKTGAPLDVIITIGETKHILTVNSSYAAPYSIEPQVYVDSWEYIGFQNIYEAHEMLVGSSVLFTGSMDAACNPDFTATIVGGNAANATLTETTQWSDRGDVKAYILTSDVAGTYTVELAAADDPNVTATFEVIVKEDYIELNGGEIYSRDAYTLYGTSVPANGFSYYGITVYEGEKYNVKITPNTEDVSILVNGTPVGAGETFVISGDDIRYNAVTFVNCTDGSYVDCLFAVEFEDLSDEGGDDASATPVMDGDELASTNATYVTTVDAGSKVYFTLYYEGAEDVLTVSWNNDSIRFATGSPKSPIMLANGASVDVDSMYNSVINFVVTNDAAEDVTFEFTLSYASQVSTEVAPTPITGTTDKFAEDYPQLAETTTTYITSIEAGTTVYFQLWYTGEIEDEVILACAQEGIRFAYGSPKTFTMLMPGYGFPVDPTFNSMLLLIVTNDNAEAVEFEFTLTFASEANAPVEIESGKMLDKMSDYVTTTYSMTIAAGESGRFTLFYPAEPGTAFNVSVVFDETVASCFSNASAYASGESFQFDYDNYNYEIQFTNTTSEEINLIFTVEYVEA